MLDRCAVSPFAEVLYKNEKYLENGGNGIKYFNDVSTITNISISSRPVKVCLCVSGKPNCTYQEHIKVKKGETFTVSLVAVDQVGDTVSGTIQTALKFSASGVAEGQLSRDIAGECTDLNFNVVSLNESEELTLYESSGPCKNADLSTMTVQIHFLPCSCPIGFQISGMTEVSCICECHSGISQFIKQCDVKTELLRTESNSRAWISYIEGTNQMRIGYLVYPNCPYDYCVSSSVSVNLNEPNGADAQCAFNRSSLLCGACQPGLSLSLGSSRCLPCPSYWPGLLTAITIAAILAGIILVALLLLLNMTVAIGTLNGLIFYVNIVYAYRSILLPFEQINFITVFISWLNLELGIDACYFPKMDAYTKTWLQLAFPAYVILLVVLIIIVSSYSDRFSNLIGKKDPVATLATLIFISYAKLLEVSFRSLSVGVLEYPDGSAENLWLPDATVKYLSEKHIPLFLVAVLILLAGLVYTVLLISWQWLLRLPNGWKILSWIRNQKLKTFIETYHTPSTPRHRYWTGLLILTRAILHLVATVNVSNNPHVALTALIFSLSCIVLFKASIRCNVYRKWPVDVLETFFFSNILFFAIFTWYSLGKTERSSDSEAVAYISIMITIAALLLIFLSHVYMCTSVFSRVKKQNFA